jgi:glyoxylase-like metal-dependent hydrolase (beta-lactamase superfamily II)
MAQEIKIIDLGMVNCYLVKTGKGFILIDTGMAFHRAALDKALAEAGCAEGNLQLVILTHGDMDHSGNGAYLRGKYKAKVAMHAGDSQMCVSGQMRWDRKITSLFHKVLFGVMFKLMIGPQLRKNPFETFTPDILLEDGQSLADWGFDAKVLSTPGHTKGSIVLLTAEGGLVCGDIFQARKKPSVTYIVEDGKELAASVERLKKLDIKTVYPGHGKRFQMAELAKT